MEGEELLLPTELPAEHRSGFVAVLGKPNVGKTTLVNRLVGQKVGIVSPKPQTTRRRLRGILTLPQAQVIFIDTPGIHQPRHKLGEYMVEAAVATLGDVDLVVFLVDVSRPPTSEDEQIAALLRGRREVGKRSPVILVLNKMDLLPPQDVQPHSDAYLGLGVHEEWMMISATKGHNCDKLLDMILERLPLGPRYYPPEQYTDQEERFIVAELVREKALRHLEQEIPHSLAVAVEEFQERREDLVYIAATLYVEKASQKGIVLGAKGKMIKAIGSEARKEIESFLGKKVYLELWVKVKEQWRR
ncbi:MAG: GTPase Era, partial [Chloroflexi bacterium]|nr:GTPase Era [Chloroflexota bacterium]